MGQPGAQVGVVAAEHVDHHGGRGQGRGGAQRQVQHGPQVLLELRGQRALDGPVAAVVRPHGDLVDQQPALGLEQLHGQQPGHVQLGGQPQPEPLGLDRRLLVQAGGRGQHLVADPVPLNGLHDGVGGALAARRPGDQDGQLALERDVLLGDQPDAVGQHGRRLIRGLADPDAPAVVAAGDRLEHDRPAALLGEGRHLGQVPHRREPRAADAQVGDPLAHGQLVLGVAQRVRAGPDRGPGLLHGRDQRAGDVLVIERDHVAVAGEGQQVVGPAVVAEHGARGDLGRALVGGGGQDPEVDAQADRGRRGHPGQLAAADHPDHRRRRLCRRRRRRPGHCTAVAHPP